MALHVHLVLTRQKKFFFHDSWKIPGMKIAIVDFGKKKLQNVINNLPLFKPDRNGSILTGTAK